MNEVLPVGSVIAFMSAIGPETLVLKQILPKRLWRRQRMYRFYGGAGVSLGRKYLVPESDLIESLSRPRVAVTLPTDVKE